jgi:hypothetical protein
MTPAERMLHKVQAETPFGLPAIHAGGRAWPGLATFGRWFWFGVAFALGAITTALALWLALLPFMGLLLRALL